MTDRAEARKTCTSHCTTCGCHFHGDSAFDAHRRDGQCMNPETAMTLKGRRLLQVWTQAGACDKELGCWVDGKRDHFVEPVTVWQAYINERAQESLRALRSRKSDAETLQLRMDDGVFI